MDKSCHSSGQESSPINPNLKSNINDKAHYFKQIHNPPVVSDDSPPYSLHHNHQSNQPPVYNVSKTNFRDVVQKLTGAPAGETLANPVPPLKPQSSRLQRVRPPPLEHVFAGQRQHHQPLSPLPPLPSVHAAAESPVSAYMRCFLTNTAGFSQHPPPQLPLPESKAPSSSIPFGCLPPMLLSPRFPFSSANQFGFQQLSPTPPAPSPRWKSL